MGRIKNEEIRGYMVDGDVVCLDCITAEELEAIEEENLILDDEVEKGEEIYFCDRCNPKKRL